MPRVLRIINRFNLGGPTYNAAFLTKYMAPEFETLLVGGFKDESEEKSDFIVNDLGIEPVIISEMRREIHPVKDIIAYNKLKKIIKDFKPDIVHTHASKAGTLGRLAAYHASIPVILHTFHGHVFHSYFMTYKSAFFKKIEQGLAKISTKIIAISDLQKDELAHKYNITKPENIVVIPLGFDLNKFRIDKDTKRQKFRREYNIDDDEIAIGIIGRLVPVKNHALFLDAINIVKQRSSKRIRAFIVGDGENRKLLVNKINELKLDYIDATKQKGKASITFTSWIKNVDRVYPGMDIVALTSLNEGTPVSLIEAQAANVPIVSTNAGGIENTVLPGITALLSKNGNPLEFTDNLFKLIESDELRHKLSLNGWDFVKEKYHYSRLVNDMSKLYKELLAEKKIR
ncbi:MAG: glycosyltransferase [Bacteroidia bacterium]|nr:glycosyltransferase [Bacteroidia bacterium]